MFICGVHATEARNQVLVDYTVYSCGGAKRGCGSFGFLASGAGPQGPCPDCGRGWTRTATMQLALGYCDQCMPYGYPDYAKPSYIPVTVVGGFVP
jgi:hypothetical protein